MVGSSGMKNAGQKTEIQIHPCKNWSNRRYHLSSQTLFTYISYCQCCNSIAALRNLKLTQIILDSDISGEQNWSQKTL